MHIGSRVQLCVCWVFDLVRVCVAQQALTALLRFTQEGFALPTFFDPLLTNTWCWHCWWCIVLS